MRKAMCRGVVAIAAGVALAAAAPATASSGPEQIRSATVGGPVKPSPGARTVPFFTSSFSDGGTAYPYSMVGSSPAGPAVTTTVPVTIVPLRIQFRDGSTFDGGSKVADVLESPIFTPAPFESGHTQYVDAMRRAEFWGSLQGKDQHLLLQPQVRPTVTVEVPQGAGQAGTSFFGAPTGYLKQSWLDARVANLMHSLNVDPRSLILFLTQDLLLLDGKGCCVGGYHGVLTGSASGAGSQSIWTYAVANWYTPGGFLFSDTTVTSHEIGEWADDPFESNAVPPWISPLPLARAVYGCYRYLEVADPTVDVEFTVDGEHHLQDQTFFPWFTREQPSPAIGGRYTYTGAIDQPAARC
jgi:hypothetical protein